MSDVPNHVQNTVITSPALVSNEVQKWTLTTVGAAKKWTIEIDGEKSTAAALVGNATAASVQTAIENMSNFTPGDVTVTGSAGGPYTVSYAGQWKEINVPTPTFTAEEGSVASADITVGGAATKARQKGTGLADRTAETSPLDGESPVTYREGHGGSY